MLCMMRWLLLSLIVQHLAHVVHLDMTRITYQVIGTWRRQVSVSALSSESSGYHHIIALNAVHGGQNAWQDS